MKKTLLILTAFLLSNMSLFACFISDPSRIVFKKQSIEIILNSSMTQYQFPVTQSSSATDVITGYWPDINKSNKKTFTCNAICAFPLTINVQFSGFENSENKTNRACLLYLDKTGRWRILKEIKNVNWSIETDNNQVRSLFGQYVIKNSLGYKDGQVLFVICYFESSSHSTHDLNTLLKTKYNNLTEQQVSNLGAIAIRVITNKKPI